MPSLLAPQPRCRYATTYTLAASLLLHGTLVAIAMLWPVRPRPAAESMVTVPWDQETPSTIPAESDSPPPAAASDTLTAPVPDLLPPAEEMPTPLDTLDIAEPDPALPVVKHAVASHLANRLTPSTARSTASSPGSGLGHAGALSGSPHSAPNARWNVSSAPIYPYALRKSKIEGSGTVRVTTDAMGHVASATILRSTGNSALDDNTCRHARTAWSGPANASIVVPVTYRMQ